MKYLKLSATLRNKKMYIFTLKDLENLFPEENLKTIKNNLTRWLSKGYFTRLKNGVYELMEHSPEIKTPDLYIANKLYRPSYVSLETALSIYSIIPDVAAGVTSITTRPTRTFKNRYGSFFYKTCKREAFTGYKLMQYDGLKVCIADKEKALVDFLYYRLRLGGGLDFEQERLNKKILGTINWNKAICYAKLFNKKTIKAVKKCREYINKY